MPGSLLVKLRQELGRAADPAKAEGMRRYMKSAMPYHGVPLPVLRSVCRRVFRLHPVRVAQGWRRDVLSLWRNARFREERYAAIELTGDPRASSFQTLETLPLYEEMIVGGAWWDYVDALATKRLGVLLRRYPTGMGRKMRAWSRCGDLWKRRSAILCQIGLKRDTDLPLLYDCIRPSLGSPEFFLRKAIGWALRQYAWMDPMEIKRYVRLHHDLMSPLSRREALKNVEHSGG